MMILQNIYSEVEKNRQNRAFNKSHPQPAYDIWKDCDAVAPKVYNAEGRLYDYFYLRDVHGAASPYGDTGKYFIWDRYNYGFPVHFYTHNEMLVNIGQPQIKYGMFVESRAIVPSDYKIFDKHKGLEKEFERIFTFDDEILNKYSNAAFFQGSAAPTYGRESGLIYDQERYKAKSKNVSILASNKGWTEMHKKRSALANYCLKNSLCDAYGRAVKPEYVDIDIPFADYRFAFVIENTITDYYFTEKIINCFASQTVPIYLGARKISEFFNEDGIIVIDEKDIDNPEAIVKKCTEEEYVGRLPAIIDNYNRVINEYMNMQDYLYKHYLMRR